MDLIGLGLLLVVGLAAVLFLVIVLTRGVFARDLTHALKRVAQQEQELQEKADILEQRIGQLELEYHAKLKRAQAEAERIVQEAKNQAMNIRTAAIEEAKHRARQLLLEAEHGKAQWKADVVKELNGQAVQHACELLRDLLSARELLSLHETLVQELLGSLGQLDAMRFRTGVERIEVRAAQPLTPSQTQQLSQWTAVSIGGHVPIQVEADPALVAGCIVQVGSTVLDNSLPNRLNQR